MHKERMRPDAHNQKLIVGTPGDDRILATARVNLIDGRDGDDHIEGGTGYDSLYGGKGHDTILGHGGDDRIYGNRGHDILLGGDGDDILSGGKGNDFLSGDNGDDELDGCGGNDTLNGGDGNDTLGGGHGDDGLLGANGDDQLMGGEGQDLFLYLPSTIHATSNHDTIIDFAKWEDRIVLFQTQVPDHASLWKVASQDGADTLFTFSETQTLRLENVLLSSLSDTDILLANEASVMRRGTDAADRLIGSVGSDYLSGGAGNDYFDGKGGNDILIGGDGADTFNFAPGFGRVVITDFNSHHGDRIRVSSALARDYEDLLQKAALSDHENFETVIRFADDAVLHLQEMVPSILEQDAFIFVA